MEQLFLIFIGIATLFCLLYVWLIASYCYGWLQTKAVIDSSVQSVFVSVIIAARNEEHNIVNCLNSIICQSYSDQYFEIIIVDDGSSDNTQKLAQEFYNKHNNIRLITLNDKENISGKKQAINAAVAIAKGELVVTTDADCVMGKNWLATIVSFYVQTQAKMIVAPVSFYDEKTIFEKMQSLEFMALIASGGASLYYNQAIMCNGANLAYTKQIFKDVNGFEDIDKKASGDDVLLMYKIKKKCSNSIHFLKNREAIVYTKAKQTIKEFSDQRKRWASKGFLALNAETKRASLIVYLFNFMLLLLAILGIFCLATTTFYPAFYEICLILIGIKCFIDFLLLFLAASFFNKKQLLIYFLPEQFIYIVYVVVAGIFGAKGKYDWKGRKIR
jgi:cellulose synthase/poly-beta-1,6-N-acetylglucosamine synthase-like glycosyltransferase